MSGAMGDMGSLLKQAQMMQRELDKVKADLAEREIEGTAGGRAVVIRLTADKKVLGVEFSAEAIAEANANELAEMTRMALTSALDEAESISKEEMGKVTGGLDLPGLM